MTLNGLLLVLHHFYTLQAQTLKNGFSVFFPPFAAPEAEINTLFLIYFLSLLFKAVLTRGLPARVKNWFFRLTTPIQESVASPQTSYCYITSLWTF